MVQSRTGSDIDYEVSIVPGKVRTVRTEPAKKRLSSSSDTVQSVRVGGGAKDFIYDHSIEGNKSEDQADEAAFLWRTTLIANQDNTGKECPFVGSLL